MGVVLLIRHGRPSLTGVLLGQVDSPLDDAGLRESSLQVDTVLTSPLRRASQTASILFPKHRAAVLPELAEIGYGEWDGLAWSEIETRWPELAAAKLKDWNGIAPPGGEPWADFEARLGVAWRVVVNAAKPCAVVAHAAVNHVLYRFATGHEFDRRQEYGEVISVEVL